MLSKITTKPKTKDKANQMNIQRKHLVNLWGRQGDPFHCGALGMDYHVVKTNRDSWLAYCDGRKFYEGLSRGEAMATCEDDIVTLIRDVLK